MKLTDDGREFIRIYDKAMQKSDTDVLIATYGVIGMLLEKRGKPESVPPLMKFTRGQYKRAIKLLRETSARVMHEGDPDMAADCNQTVRYIREHCLNRTKMAAEALCCAAGKPGDCMKGEC